MVGLACVSLQYNERLLGYNGCMEIVAKYSLLISLAQEAENS